jgi:adenine-specific DNA-methyltransferase
MMTRKHRLELMWPDKDKVTSPEPRVLLEKELFKSGLKGKKNIKENLLIYGDNLLGLKALERDYTGKIKCIYIDPPYNTKSCFTHYDDSMEHSLWLNMMKDRLLIMHRLLSEDGSIWISIDAGECHYLKVMCDEIFGRHNFAADIAWRSADSSNNDAKEFSLDHNNLLVYSKQTAWRPKQLSRTDEDNKHYKNPDNDPRGPWFSGNLSSPKPRPNLQYDVTSPTGTIIPSPKNGWRWARERMDEMISTGEIVFSSDGTRLTRKTYLTNQKGLAPSSIWADHHTTGHNRQAKYELKKLFPDTPTADLFATPKPERLLQRILDLATNEGDLVLDSFAGSGTTGAVAHKMGRRWIMIELNPHCKTHIIPRLQKVIDGTDQGGITEAVEWKGGGWFRLCELAPSLLERNHIGRWTISQKYNPILLAEAVCLHAGFNFTPKRDPWWMHGSSTERDFIYVTSSTLCSKQLKQLSDEVGTDRTLLIYCEAFHGKSDDFPNLTIEKIPKKILTRCEWGQDDYSLKILDALEFEAKAINKEKLSKNATMTISAAAKTVRKGKKK